MGIFWRIGVSGRKHMLRMSVRNEEYLLIGDDIKISFLGGGAGQAMLMSA